MLAIRENKTDTTAASGSKWAPKSMARCLKRNQILEDGRVPAKEAKNWRIDGKKRRITRKECRRLVNKFELDRKACGILQKKKIAGQRRTAREEVM